jgi:hypothetical protein
MFEFKSMNAVEKYNQKQNYFETEFNELNLHLRTEKESRENYTIGLFNCDMIELIVKL